MNLPNAHLAIVDYEKITEYLLNAAHPDNGGKAEFFDGLGFTRDGWRGRVGALRLVASSFPISDAMESAHGIKYIIDGNIEAPNGRSATVRTIWIVDQGQDRPRLVTAYPRQEARA